MNDKVRFRRLLPDIITSAVYFGLGISIRHFPQKFLTYTYYIITSLLSLSAARSVYSFFRKKKDISVLEGFFNIIMAMILIIRPFSIYYMIKFACSMYFLMLATVHTIAFLQRIINRSGLKPGLLLMGIFEVIFAYDLFFKNNNTLYYLGRILGLNFMMYGTTIILDLLAAELSEEGKKRKRIHISLPNIFCAFIPRRLLNTINRFLQKSGADKNIVNRPKRDDHQLEIFIHMADTFFGQVGHIDMCYNSHVISYGSYDESSYKLNGMLGDGVVELIDREKYIRFCLEEAGKHIVSFGIRLDEEDEFRLQKKLTDIYNNLTPWFPPIAVYGRNLMWTAKYELDYASSLYAKTNARFYKFKDGTYSKFKTYFGLFTNCAAMAKEITAEIGINLFDFSGILTPGTFYEYLNGEYNRGNSFVVSRELYALSENANKTVE